VEVDISTLKPGEMTTVEWRGKPVWILKRTPEMMASLPKTEDKVADPQSAKPYTMDLPEYCEKQSRSRKEHPEILVTVGICSHLGCSPSSKFRLALSLLCQMTGRADLCPCHGSTFDLAGAYSKTNQLRKIWMCHDICFCRTPKS
jgi:ubiquinol-cytochrome c reductase iron-sulfur subunit